MKRKLKSALHEHVKRSKGCGQSQRSETHGSQSQHSETGRSQSQCSETHGSQSLRSETHGSQSLRSETHGSQSLRSETHGSQSQPSEAHGSQSQPSEAHGSQSQRLETHGSEACESDSGFSSGRSSPLSGRSSPVMSLSPVEGGVRGVRTSVVSLDCEMVGTGPGGRVSEVARCSLVDYHGNILFDEYIRPIGRVTDYRSQWSGIRKHHLTQATPFSQAREQVRSLLEGKVLVGHSVQTDLKSLDLVHPGHMIRDTSCSRLLTRLAGFPRKHRPSLKVLTNRLLHREIQVGRRGHCSVEDSLAALSLYKLVEGEWEREAELSLRDERDPAPPSYASSRHYMNDEYWPAHFT